MRMLNHRYFSAAGLVTAGAMLLGGCTGKTTDRDIKALTGGDVQKLRAAALQSPSKRVVIFIDPRSRDEYAAGRIPGARSLSLPEVPLKAPRNPDISSYGTILVYGNNPASAVAKGMTKRLLANGYEGVRYFPGGLEEWRRLGGEIEADAPAPDSQPPKN